MCIKNLLSLFLICVSFSGFASEEICDDDQHKMSIQDQTSKLKRVVRDTWQERPSCLTAKADYKNPEAEIFEQMSSLSEDEVAVRLIFAETMASNCVGAEMAQVSQAITEVIQNRVLENNNKKYGAGLKGVIFKKYQFRSTTGGCREAKRIEFLCPFQSEKDSTGQDKSSEIIKREKQAWEFARKAYFDSKKDGYVKRYGKGYNHYFFKNHFNNPEGSCTQKYGGKNPNYEDSVSKENKTAITGKGYKVITDESPQEIECMSLYRGVR